jgi:hypothetical protein
VKKMDDDGLTKTDYLRQIVNELRNINETLCDLLEEMRKLKHERC